MLYTRQGADLSSLYGSPDGLLCEVQPATSRTIMELCIGPTERVQSCT